MVRESPGASVSITIRSIIRRPVAISLPGILTPRASVSEIFPDEDLEGARPQLARKNDIVVPGKQEGGRPLYREIEGLRIAVGWTVLVATLSALREICTM
jgi:hypothetical protein